MSVISLTERSHAGGLFEVAVAFEGSGESVVAVRDPFASDPAGEALLAWYFQEHLRYPFLDKDREQAALEQIGAYGLGLFDQVFAAGSEAGYEYRRARDAGFDTVRVEVVGSTAFQRLHWEAIRDPDVAVPLGVRLPVVRRVAEVRAGFDVPEQRGVLNILVVTARPGGARDAGYRTISKPLLAALRQAQIAVNVDIVRPGTWLALREHLQAATRRHGSGWYAIAHFDVHGAVLSSAQIGGASPAQYLFGDDTPWGVLGGRLCSLKPLRTARRGRLRRRQWQACSLSTACRSRSSMPASQRCSSRQARQMRRVLRRRWRRPACRSRWEWRTPLPSRPRS